MEEVEGMIEITQSQAESLLDFIEVHFLSSLRNDVDIDNMQYVANICDIWKMLNERCKK